MNRKNIEDLYPLSPLQQGMLFHTLYSPGSGAYLEQMTLTLVGPVHAEAFRRAWQRVIDRHPVLRSGFVWEGVPQPLQVVFRQVELPWEYEDWRALPAEERERRFAERMERELAEGIDLARPQVRVRLYRTGDQEHRFVFTSHHMLLDGWSLPIVLGEFGALYGGFVHGQEPRLPARRPFREYIAWLNQQDASAVEAFWRARLAGFQAPTPLPLDRDPARAGVPAEVHAQERADFPAELAEALEQAARRLRVTPSGMLQCAWGAVLAAYAGERDVVFGATVSGRPPELPGVEEMVGMFINTVPVRIRVPRGVTVEAWVQAAHREQAEARLYEHAQLAQVRTWSEVPPGSSLFETLLVYENYPLDTLNDGGAHFDAAGDEPEEEEGFRIAAGSSPERTNYPLSLVAAPVPGDFRLTATYDPSRLSAESVRALLDGLGRVLRQMIDAPQRLAEELTPLGEDELRRVVHGFNGEPLELPAAGLTVARLFEAAAARTPDAVALEHEGVRITYAELNARANRLAHHLRALGVGPEVSVGVCLERTPELVVALLAVQKAGGAHVPLDPNHPAERLGWMVENAAAPVVIAEARTVAALPRTASAEVRECGTASAEVRECGSALESARDPRTPALPHSRTFVLRVDAEREAIAARSPENPDVFAAPESLAWTLYTSGSTGRPKGVQIEQRNAVTFLHWMRGWVAEEELAGVLFSTSASFDVSVAELFFTLCWGGRLVMVENALSLGVLGDEAGVVRASMVPAAAAELARMGGVPRTVRTFGLAGEPLPPATVEALYALGHVRRVENLYGPTEDTTYSCAWVAPRGTERVLIGRPIASTRGYVLDDALRPVPLGARGELYLAGDGVTRGYRGRPEQTAERYLPDPFGPPGTRMYRTGDQARRLETGELDYLGRADFQVKVRGFRIELGEIESVLLAHPAVDETVVVAAPEEGGGHRLVAYTAPTGADAAALKEHLGASLPDYMVPAAFVALGALPRTLNGKVDRAALPDPGAPRAEEYVAPRTRTEEALAEIWAEVLKVERAGATGHFFVLGGHSLLATQVVSRARAAFGVQLPLRALFEHPTLEGLAAAVDDLLAAGEGGTEAAPAPPAVVPVARGGDLPASLQQERLWFIEQMDPGTAGYTIALALALEGALDAAALRRALGEVVRRHEPLRTVFAEVEGHPVQRVLPFEGFALEVEDLSAGGPEAAEAEAEKRIAEEVGRGFDLARGPLFRARLLRLAGERHALVLVLHHIVSDGWSMGVLMRELSALYAAFRRGLPSPLAALPVQYADYAVWQRSAASALEGQMAWWLDHLADAPHVLDLPTDRRRPPTRSVRGGHVGLTIDAATLRRVKEVAYAEGATPFMVLLAAWQLLLARYAGTDDVLVGTPIAGRTLQETEGLIGLFVNTLALRARLAPGESFRQLLAVVRDDVLSAFAHQDVPFERLVDALGVERDLARTPLYQAMFSLQNAGAGDPPSFDGVRVDGLGVPLDTAKTDLVLSLDEAGDALHGTLEYSTDLFERATAERMVEQLGVLLSAALADPGRAVDDLPLADRDEGARMLRLGRGPSPGLPPLPIHRLFEARTAARPGAVALVDDSGRVTYGELNARANRLARRLRELGVGPEARVGVAMERSPELVVALLAVFKAGGACVPLDPVYPADRVAFMRADSGISVMIADATVDAGEEDASVRVLSLAAERARIDALPAHDLAEVAVDPDNLAYVFYTSGSTGTPKGVGVPHRGPVRLVLGQEFARFAADEVFLQIAPVGFDASVVEVWGALLNGGTVAIHPPRLPEPAELGEFVTRHGVTTAPLTAGLFHQVVAAGAPGLGGVRQVFAGGDVLSPAHVGRALELLPALHLLDTYGPTECATFAAAHRIRREDVEAGSIPIGRPLANTHAYVLDAAMRPVPVGVPGELFLGGAGLARGYLARPALTAERFVPDPVSGIPGARLYRTGDRARWKEVREYEGTKVREWNSQEAEDGSTLALSHSRTFVLEFLGRMDRQVKLRGFRVEPGEIEMALLAHPDVRSAVVDVREDGPAGRRLAAYVVPAEGAAVDAAALRAHLSRSLPEYMVPAAFVAMDEIPLTANGKVDRAALPAPEVRGTAAARPLTATEAAVAAIWAELLGAQGVGPEDGFFELGGHSLLAAQVVGRIRAAFQVELPLRALFEAPRLEALAARIDAAMGKGTAAADPIVSVPRDEPIPLSFAQERLWFLQQLDPASSLYNMPTPMRFRGALDEAALRRALDEIVRRHESLRTVFVLEGAQPVQRILPAAAVPLPVHRLEHLPGAERMGAARRMVNEETVTPFDLERGPVFRALLLRLGEDDHLLMVNFHHVASDGWSVNVFGRELLALYGAYRAGRPSPLPELPVQYADFAAWQRAWLTEERVREQVGYWTRQLAGAPPALELPTDRPRPAVQRHRGANLTFLLPPDLHAQVRALAARSGATVAMTLLAAFQLVLGRLAGQDDVVVGTPIAGRTRPETEPMIGLFLNTLAIRTRLAGEESFAELLRQVRETMLGAYAHQDVPFERLLEELSPERTLSRTPVFQVLFNMLNLEGSYAGSAEEVEVAGLTPVPFEGELDTGSKFDLTLYVQELEEGISIDAAYDADLFDGERIGGMMRQLAGVLRQVAADPSVRLDGVSLLTDDARPALPDPAEPLPDAWRGSVPELFARRAAEAPHALAAEDPRERWSYAELDRATARIAGRLVESGVRPGDVVAIWGHRSAALVRALLGTLRSGGAFLVLDPAYPSSRLADYLRIARPTAFLRLSAAAEVPAEVEEALSATSRCTITLGARTESAGAPRQPSPGAPDSRPHVTSEASPSLPQAVLGEGPARSARERASGDGALEDALAAIDALASVPPVAPSVAIGSDTLAYLSFTSGTTGVPKAVMGRHGSLTHFTPWLAEAFGLTADDRFSMLSGLAHDPLHRDVFTPLQLGAAVVAPEPEEVGAPGYLAGWLRRAAVTVAHLTPAMGQLIADVSGGVEAAAPVESLRRAFFVGDVLRRGDVERLRRLAPNLTVVNYYGSTETQRAVAYHVVDLDDGGRAALDDAGSTGPSLASHERSEHVPPPQSGGGTGAQRQGEGPARPSSREVIPLGRGIPGVQLLVRTAAGALAGIGEVGEVWLRSPHVALGYLNDPALTAERFVPNPWRAHPGDVLYRTGDLGRYRPDGEVEPMGRADRQVQVRGFRVEPGEVEAALAAHPAVRAAAVVPRDGAGGAKTLVAYVVTDLDDAAAELRPFLAGRLADYMVPGAFVRLDALPLTANGKLDVAALPDPNHAEPEAWVAPRTAAEQVVAEIWAEVLGRERVGAEDNFFALGGHSLLATQVLSRVEQAFGVKLPVRALFEESTVAALAARLEASGEGALAEAMAELDNLSEEELMALLAETEGAEGD
ncbi:MAG: amino acid adenylation domain-containing protein [Longimicrobiaceae bacterium]